MINYGYCAIIVIRIVFQCRNCVFCFKSLPIRDNFVPVILIKTFPKSLLCVLIRNFIFEINSKTSDYFPNLLIAIHPVCPFCTNLTVCLPCVFFKTEGFSVILIRRRHKTKRAVAQFISRGHIVRGHGKSFCLLFFEA